MTIRHLPFFLVLLGFALPTVAQTPARTPGPPRFLLEQILVEGTRRDAVREIVAAESLLQPGREYSEQELREAVYRVKRLPFVLDAEFSLRKGAERGSYQLVITIDETRLVFYSADVGGAYDGNVRNLGPEEDRVDWGGSATVGGRWFLGSQGLLFGSVFGLDSEGPVSAQAGYTHYNLFGRGGFASAALAANLDEEDHGEATQASLSTGLPIVGNHSLRADLSWFESKIDSFDFSSRSVSWGVGLSWIYDTTDDPLFPTSGTRASAGVGYGEQEDEFQSPAFPTERTRSDSYGLQLSGSRHWALTHRQAVSTGLAASWGEAHRSSSPTDMEQWSASATLGHSMDLWGFEKTERIGDFRWETGVAFDSRWFEAPTIRTTTLDGRLFTGLVFRNAWGLMRLSFSYGRNLQQDVRARQVFL